MILARNDGEKLLWSQSEIGPIDGLFISVNSPDPLPQLAIDLGWQRFGTPDTNPLCDIDLAAEMLGVSASTAQMVEMC